VKIRSLVVGRPRDAEATALHDRYAARLERLGVTYEAAWVAEVRSGGRFSDEHVREREARLLGEKLPDRGRLIALDGRGRELTSAQLARRLGDWARVEATFVVGGPLGLHRPFLDRADWVWSLSALTFPHELVRAILVEQLYRALTLLRGVPYHK